MKEKTTHWPRTTILILIACGIVGLILSAVLFFRDPGPTYASATLVLTFDGAAGRFGYQPLQTPLKFERMGNGGLQNRAFMFVHYKDDRTIETVNY